MLKKGAYAALMDNEEDPENDAAKQFCEEDIDSILERRTQVIRRGPQEERPVDESHVDGTVAADGSLFSKATFSLGEETTAEDDLEDPHFWEKWAQKANIDTTVHVDDGIQGLIVEEPRRRKRTQHLNMADDSDEVASLPEKTKAPSRSSKKNAVLPWSLAERTRLERSLMMYGFGAWEKKISQFPKRSINDIKSAELRVLRYCVEKMRESIAERAGTKVAADSKRQSSVSTSSEAKKKASAASREENRVLREDQRLVDDIDAMVATLQWDIPELSDIERMAREGCAESFIGRDFDLEVDPQLGPYPYPGATRDKLLAYRSIVDEAPPEYLDNLGKKKKNLLFRGRPWRV